MDNNANSNYDTKRGMIEMIAAIDIETKGLDATKLIMGTTITEKRTTPETKYKKEELWQQVIEMGKSCANRNKTLNLYAHNHAFDFYGYANITQKGIKFYSQTPFIASLEIEKDGKKREMIKFLDTWAIFKMTLKELAKMVGMEKGEMPEELETEKGTITKKKMEEIRKYNIQDTQIVLNSILYLKKFLKEEERINIKRLMTINQIAIQFLITKLQKMEDKKTEHLFYNKEKGQFYRTFRSEEIHKAYRGARTECWIKGVVEDVTVLDKRNLYGSRLAKMRCPDLRTERKIWRPTTSTPITEDELLDKIGISQCMVKNENNTLGLLPIRTPEGNYYPKKNKYLIGTWTHNELKLAKQEGYKIIKILWSVTYEEAYNPFREIMEEVFEKRMEAEKGTFKYWFYKEVQNRGIGKMAQYRTDQESVIDSVEKAEEYCKRMYEITKGIGLKYVYTLKNKKGKTKKYYVPIIPTIVNADARIEMYLEFKKLKEGELYYTDTDSIHMKSGENIKKFKISKELGEFKIEHENKRAKYYGKKTYSIGDEIKISGIRKRDVTKEQFEEGIVISKTMNTIKTTKDEKLLGKFTKEERDLNKQMTKGMKTEETMESIGLYIDNDIENIEDFINEINQIQV